MRAKRNSESVSAVGVAVAPAAGADIATIAAASLPAGLYFVETYVGLVGGTPAAAERNNMRLLRATTPYATLLVVAVAQASAPPKSFLIRLDGAQALTIEAIGAGTASVEYYAQIVARRIV